MNRPATNELATLPQIARRYGIGVKAVRRAARSGCFPVYMVGTNWPRARLAEVESWIRSTRVRTTSHAAERVAELLARGPGTGR